jgi:hypothetical protein
MFPGNQLSTAPVAAQLLYPDTLRSAKLVDWEDGGVALGDPSQGLKGYTWKCWAENSNDIYLQRGSDSPSLYTTAAGVLELAFAFDQNMRPAMAFQHTAQRIDLLWYDTIAQNYVRTVGITTGRSPRLALDDKRPRQVGASDIIFAYLRGTALYYRLQRDRYLQEYTAATGLSTLSKLQNIGMGTNNRFHFIIR